MRIAYFRGILILLVLLFFVVGPCCAQSKPKQHDVTVTAYAIPRGKAITASGIGLKPRHHWTVVALSRDLARRYRFGDRFILHVRGCVYEVVFQDLMPPQHHNKIDFLLPSTSTCRAFGKARGTLIPK